MPGDGDLRSNSYAAVVAAADSPHCSLYGGRPRLITGLFIARWRNILIRMLPTSRLALFTFALFAFASFSRADDSARLLRVDHYVRVHSTVPSIAGQLSQIYVREVAEAGIALRAPSAN